MAVDGINASVKPQSPIQVSDRITYELQEPATQVVSLIPSQDNGQQTDKLKTLLAWATGLGTLAFIGLGSLWYAGRQVSYKGIKHINNETLNISLEIGKFFKYYTKVAEAKLKEGKLSEGQKRELKRNLYFLDPDGRFLAFHRWEKSRGGTVWSIIQHNEPSAEALKIVGIQKGELPSEKVQNKNNNSSSTNRRASTDPINVWVGADTGKFELAPNNPLIHIRTGWETVLNRFGLTNSSKPATTYSSPKVLVPA